MDLTLGPTIFKLDGMWSSNYSTFFFSMDKRPLMSIILKVPQFKQQYENLFVNMSQSLINHVIVNDRSNTLVDMITEDVACDQTLSRVGANLISQMGVFINSGSTNAAATVVVDDTFPNNLDMDTITDFANRMNVSIPFSTALNSNTGHLSLSGVKEWFQTSSENTLKFFGAGNSSSAVNTIITTP